MYLFRKKGHFCLKGGGGGGGVVRTQRLSPLTVRSDLRMNLKNSHSLCKIGRAVMTYSLKS